MSGRDILFTKQQGKLLDIEMEKEGSSRTVSFIKIIQCREFAKEDLISWLSEPVVYGDPVIFGEEVSEEETAEEAELKSQKRELSLLLSRLRSIKDKERNNRNERIALRQQIKKFQRDLKEERKK